MQLDFALQILQSLPLPILPLMLLAPLIGAFLSLLTGSRAARAITLVISLFELGLAVLLALGIDPSSDMTFLWAYTFGRIYVSGDWANMQLALGVDGISVVMILLSNIVTLIAAISSNHINKSQSLYYSLFMFMQTGLLGVFMSIDLVGFFVMWELVLIPMFFIIGKWGEEGCKHAAIKFFIFTHFGSAIMLVGFFVIFFFGGHTFNMLALRDMSLPSMVQMGYVLAVFMGAGVKLPVFPMHTWLPWAHVKAPTPGSVILAGILLKMGGYAFIRLGVWLVPDAFARLSIPFVILAIFTCIYAAFTAMAQTDLKSMVAYTSINHMSWVLLGVAVGTSLAIQGAVFMMFSHGTIISVMFIMAGQLKYSAGTREIPKVKGLLKQAPRMSVLLILASFAAFGLPGFSGFIAELLIIFGAVMIYPLSGLIAFGIFITVGYLLWTLNRIVFSEPDPESGVKEASWSDLIAPVLMMIPVILLGVWPDLILNLIAPAVDNMLGVIP